MNEDWGSLYAPKLHKDKTFLQMLGLVARAASKRGIFVILEGLFFTIVFQMPFRIDFGSIFPPNLAPKIHQHQ